MGPITERITRAISDAGLSRAGVGRAIGMGPDRFYRCEQRELWTPQEVTAIAGVLGIPADELVEGPLPPPVAGSVTERIRRLARHRGMSRTVLAELAGIPQWRWQRLYRHDSWRTKDLAAIAAVFRVRVETLAGTWADDTEEGEEAA